MKRATDSPAPTHCMAFGPFTTTNLGSCPRLHAFACFAGSKIPQVENRPGYLRKGITMKSSISSGVLFCLIGLATLVAGDNPKREENGSTQTESKNSQIDAKTDRFSCKSTLVVRPQALIDKPGHYVDLTIKTEVS